MGLKTYETMSVRWLFGNGGLVDWLYAYVFSPFAWQFLLFLTLNLWVCASLCNVFRVISVPTAKSESHFVDLLWPELVAT